MCTNARYAFARVMDSYSAMLSGVTATGAISRARAWTICGLLLDSSSMF